MKLHPNIYNSIVRTTNKIFENRLTTDVAIRDVTKVNKKWGSRDRKTFAKYTYDIVRHYILLNKVANTDKLYKNPLDVYISHLNDNGEFSFDSLIYDYPELEFKDRYSITPVCMEIFESNDPNYEENIAAMNCKADIYLRINHCLISIEEFSNRLDKFNIKHDIIKSITIDKREFNDLNCVKVYDRINPNSDFYKENSDYFEFQDISSQILGSIIRISKDKTIVEACAGNGGKTIDMLCRIDHSNKIIAFDINGTKLSDLMDRARRLNVSNIKTQLSELENILKYEGKADYLMIDAPCTGSGTIKRQSELKYKINNKFLNNKILSQHKIIENYNNCLKTGGKLYYSTCSLFESENENNVNIILSKGYKLEDKIKLNPKDYGLDGFFIAVFTKL